MNKFKIGWLPQSYDLNDATARVRCFYVARKLNEFGYISEVIQSEQIHNYDIIITQKHIKKLLENYKGKVILDWDDGYLSEKDVNEVLSFYSKVIVGCNKANEIILGNKGVVIEFPIESTLQKEDYTWNNKIVFIGTYPDISKDIFNYLRDNGFIVEIISSSDVKDKTQTWKLDTWQQETIKCDIGLVCFPSKEVWKDLIGSVNIETKDNERASEFMSLGLPTIVSPLDSHNFIKHGEDGFIANTKEEFLNYCNLLKNMTVEERKQIGGKARQKALNFFNIEIIARKYERLIKKVLYDI